MKRRIPTTMMTQHPDSATRYISVQEEPAEALDALRAVPEGLGLEEVMIDFEGKLTPYHQTAQVVMELLQRNIIPGKDVYVTPRVANARKETAFRQIMAFLSIMETIVSSKELSNIQAVIEIILPMASSSKELIEVKKRIESVIALTHQEFITQGKIDTLQIIPLFEEVPELLKIDQIIKDFVTNLNSESNKTEYLRFMLGRSDSALSYGNVSAMLANRIAISKAYEAGNSLGIDVYPIFGGGALPFRGHITLDNIHNVLKTYPGLRTITIQSGIRYDQSRDKTQKLSEILREELPKSMPHIYAEEELKNLYNCIGIFTCTYLDVFLKIMPLVAKFSDYMPKQRDRLSRNSGVGYARDVAKPREIAEFVSEDKIREELYKYDTDVQIALPRAITFTATLYSVGLPPSFIGTGRGLNRIRRLWGQKALDDFLKNCPTLKADLEYDIRFINLNNIRRVFDDEAVRLIEEDIYYCCDIFGLSLLSEKEKHTDIYHILMDSSLGIFSHLEKAADISRPHEIELLQHWLKEMGSIRGSLG
ncbi:phosphoenolpyruvate carboxylase [Mobilitalea sibirica]|uniref:Phosphoenolpyruvate carboxylase n=1 Tax=Mobilitalea sibirica TaxID=1462919 RepID=A0A8J7KSH1_9FIRM|nr:phosphoenolpyruvate carboxylase [Mobilitalea sibirica]MBH1940296.1 phosphoenolpyruvate carboxylase [Mobilitalea sibirica]